VINNLTAGQLELLKQPKKNQFLGVAQWRAVRRCNGRPLVRISIRLLGFLDSNFLFRFIAF
jgi:hypothetical protein